MSPAERAAEQNGIWLCATHAHQIDHDEQHFTADLLHNWKREALERAFRAHADVKVPSAPPPSQELIDELKGLASQLGLPHEDDFAVVKQRVMACAQDALDNNSALPPTFLHENDD